MKDKIKLNISAGGIFSKFMFGIQNLENISPETDIFYFNNIDERARASNITNNPFDYVIKQNYDSTFREVNTVHLGNYSKFKPIENCTKISNFKKITSKIQLADSLKEELNFYENKFNFDEKTLGIHIRLCDMNIAHANDYGILFYSDYENHIEKYINEFDKIFIASDNNESIDKLIKKYGNKMNYVPDIIRAQTENEDTIMLQISNFNTERFWIESFLEMLLLSRCSAMICRTSNLANASIVFSNTLKSIIRL